MVIPIPLAAATAGNVIDFFIKGGVFMIPLLICSIVGIAIIILRAFALREGAVLPSAIEREIETFPPGTPPERLARLVHGNPSPLARIVRVALDNLNRSKADNMEAVQIRARQEMLHLESGIVVLELIVGIGPLLGLLGAVSGLVGVFGSLGTTGAGADPAGVAKGIAEALHTTIMGLAVAIPSLVAFSYFSKKVEVFAIQMETLIGAILSKCYGHDSSQPSPMAISLASTQPLSPAPLDFSSPPPLPRTLERNLRKTILPAPAKQQAPSKAQASFSFPPRDPSHPGSSHPVE